MDYWCCAGRGFRIGGCHRDPVEGRRKVLPAQAGKGRCPKKKFEKEIEIMMQISLSNQKGGTEGSLLRYRIYLVPVFFYQPYKNYCPKSILKFVLLK